MQKLDLTYPCTWSYCAIGSDREAMMREIPVKLGAIPHAIAPGNKSSAGNYCSLYIDATVRSEEQRLAIASLLKSITGVKAVL